MVGGKKIVAKIHLCINGNCEAGYSTDRKPDEAGTFWDADVAMRRSYLIGAVPGAWCALARWQQYASTMQFATKINTSTIIE